MIVERNGTTATIGPSDGPVLTKVAVVLGPELVLGTVTVVVAVEGMARIIRRIVLCKRLDDIELYSWVAREAIESKIGVALGIVVGGIVDHATW
jgi:hypothetical protein